METMGNPDSPKFRTSFRLFLKLPHSGKKSLPYTPPWEAASTPKYLVKRKVSWSWGIALTVAAN